MSKEREELKPCPFCGGEAQIDDCRTIYRVVCKNSQCESVILGERAPEPDGTESDEYWEYIRQTAINRWNTRANIDQWISVDDVERLPKFGVPVEVWNERLGFESHFAIEKARRVKTNDCGDWSWYALDITNTMLVNVTHWKPLPEPPEAP